MRTTTVKKEIKQPGIESMFSQMLGEGNVNMDIAIPKYKNIIDKMQKMVNAISCIFTNELIGGYIIEEYSNGIGGFISFATFLQETIHKHTIEEYKHRLSNNELRELNKHPEKIQEYMMRIQHPYEQEEFNEVYQSLKECKAIEVITLFTSGLKKYIRQHSKSDTITHENFCEELEDIISNSKEVSLELIPDITCLDFKIFYEDPNIGRDYVSLVIKMVSILYKHSLVILDTVIQPDIDLDEFIQVFDENIDKLKSHPKLTGCQKAFKNIRASVSMLKDNFSTYYKNFIYSKNPTIILESFVMDIAEKETDLRVIPQYRKIVDVYWSMSKSINDPKLDSIFKEIEKKFDILSSNT